MVAKCFITIKTIKIKFILWKISLKYKNKYAGMSNVKYISLNIYHWKSKGFYVKLVYVE